MNVFHVTELYTLKTVQMAKFYIIYILPQFLKKWKREAENDAMWEGLSSMEEEARLQKEDG